MSKSLKRQQTEIEMKEIRAKKWGTVGYDSIRFACCYRILIEDGRDWVPRWSVEIPLRLCEELVGQSPRRNEHSRSLLKWNSE